MIISRTPLRISFVGGGSDIESFYKQEKGAVVSTTLNKYVYIMVNRQFDGRTIVNYSKTEVVKNINQIKNNLVREALKFISVTDGIHIASISDIPSEGTGMGSSSSYIVGLLHALYAYTGRYIDAGRLGKEACYIEIDVLKKPIGKQDQYIAAFGGFQFIQFNPDDTVFVDPIICSPDTKQKLQSHLLLLYTGVTRSADPILARQNKNMISTSKKRDIMRKMVKLSYALRDDLRKNKLSSFGEMLHENWLLKKRMADGISTRKIDSWYEKATKNGAIGGKILGAGGGGFLLLFAKPKDHKRIINALKDLVRVPFAFESEGSKIIFVGD